MKRWVFTLTVLIQMLGSPVFAGDADLGYFKQFLYREESVGSDPDFPQYQYRFLMSDFNDPYIHLADGRYLRVRLELQLFEDGTYKALYNEYFFETPDAMQFLPGACKEISGRWSVPDTKLVLEGLGIGERVTLHGVYGVKLTYTQDYATTGVSGQSSNFNFGYSQQSDIKCFPF